MSPSLKIYLQTQLQSALNNTIFGFALGIVKKWITLVQQRIELYTLRTFRQPYVCTVKGGKLKTEEVLLKNIMSHEATDSDYKYL
jgi:hypothetical protein